MNALKYNRLDLEFAMRGYENLLGALTLRENRKMDYEFRTTILFLAGFGIEIVLKAELFHAGLSQKKVKAYGHNISEMWSSRECKPLRVDTHHFAEQVEMNSISFDKHIAELDHLHGSSSRFTLRYVTKPDAVALDPIILILPFLQATRNQIERCLELWKKQGGDAYLVDEIKTLLANSHYMNRDFGFDAAQPSQ